MTRPSFAPLGLIFSLTLLLCFPTPATSQALADSSLHEPQPTTVLVRVVAHGAMVLGREVGGARVTITDVASGHILATGLQQGESGDQNQIMRTPHLMEEPIYSARPGEHLLQGSACGSH